MSQNQVGQTLPEKKRKTPILRHSTRLPAEPAHTVTAFIYGPATTRQGVSSPSALSLPPFFKIRFCFILCPSETIDYPASCTFRNKCDRTADRRGSFSLGAAGLWQRPARKEAARLEGKTAKAEDGWFSTAHIAAGWENPVPSQTFILLFFCSCCAELPQSVPPAGSLFFLRLWRCLRDRALQSFFRAGASINS